ncbi:heme-dependent oxidative N-demethylase family protein [Acuticoccus sp.]|uniref:heme-dependent oxidative N-demethylase family protein n=1 Tax=Acuticoccus sp. TaxID=1904378 RepID=UPI003B5158D1
MTRLGALPRPLHAPYAGRHRPFSIAMAPLDPAEWLEVDDRRDADLALKAEVFAADPGAVRTEPGTEGAQEEVERRIAGHLAARGVALPATDSVSAPIQRAALLVQDDLVVMRRGTDGWRLVAAALAFPSSWLLAEKFGRPMDTIHADVPGWAGAMGTRVGRIFDALPDDALVWRLNWSLQFGGGLPMPRSKREPAPAASLDDALVRVERQTLRRLATGDLLFTIKVMLDPVEALARHPDGTRLVAGLVTQLAALDDAQLAYKGLTERRDALLDRLAGLRP